MLPVARANLDLICCICFLDVKPLKPTQTVYDVKKEKNLLKILKLTAYITILKNPINQKYIDVYCRKVCETCFVKVQYSYTFREKIIASTTTLKELLENGELDELDIDRLTNFCRICLNRQNDFKNTKCISMKHLHWLKDCSGIRITSLVDKEIFRIKEGTNINEIAVVNDTHFPKQLCVSCFKKLQNVEEFRRSATQSFEYMISILNDEIGPEDYLMVQDVNQTKENIIFKKEEQTETLFINCANFGIDNTNIKLENESPSEEIHDILNDEQSITNTSNLQQLEDDTFRRKMEFTDDHNYLDTNNEDITLNLNNNEFGVCSDNENKNCLLRKTRSLKLVQCNVNKRNLRSKEENIKTENTIKPKVKRSKNGKQLDKRKTTPCKEDDETFVCEECWKIFSKRKALNRHKKTVHSFDSAQMLECLICSKKFKRQSHLTDHIQAVHEKLRPFKCSHCTKTFTAKNSRRVHELQHTGEYPFVCNFCEKVFRRSYQLKVHKEIHTAKPELLCTICKRSQKSQIDLENHLKTHSDKRLQCPLCGKFFSRSDHLKDHHNAVHLKLRPFKCQFCQSTFGDRKNRRIHERNHTEDRPIKCSVCRSGFTTKSALTKHIHHFCNNVEKNESN